MSSKRWDSRPQSICRCSINPKAGQRCVPARTCYFEMLGSAKSVQYSYAGAFSKVTIRSTRNKIPFSGHMMLLWHIKYSKPVYLFILFLGRSHCQGRTAWLCTAVELVWTRPNTKGVKECIVSQTAAIKVAATPVYKLFATLLWKDPHWFSSRDIYSITLWVGLEIHCQVHCHVSCASAFVHG